jgi:maltokinase
MIDLTDPTLIAALAGWLPAQRWFADKGRTITGVRPSAVVELSTPEAEGVLAVASVDFTDGTRHWYQLPLGRRGTLPAALRPALVARLSGAVIYDAVADPTLMSVLFRHIAYGGTHGRLLVTTTSPVVPEAGSRVRPVSGEQSNSSLVFADRYILKLFRLLSAGQHPEVEIHRGLAGEPHLVPLHAALEGPVAGDWGVLGVLHAFVPDAVDGWRSVTSAMDAGQPVGPRLRELGTAVGRVHTALADVFGVRPVTAAAADEIRDGMLARLADAVREVPALAAYEDGVRQVFTRGCAALGGFLQRVHGDLHLGQVLHGSTGWLLIDFEGEPSVSLAERRARHSPLRDVAGMLRSFGYAAGRPDAPPAAGAWATEAARAFLAGYREVTGLGEDAFAALRAYELDKAVYEARYETRNRPDWLPVPLRAVGALTEGERRR